MLTIQLRLIALTITSLFIGACARPLPKYEKPIARAQFQNVRTTAYTHTESDHRVHGNRTTLGTTLRCGAINSAAADWSRWPAGTMFRILETGELFEVDDIGWALSGRNTIDLYKPSRSAMNTWGVRTVNIEVLRWGDDAQSLDLLRKRNKYRHVQRMEKDLERRIARGETNPEPAVVVSTSINVPTTGSENLQ
jgi:3D (Asp-Asp-Asp) domain-containing protein